MTSTISQIYGLNPENKKIAIKTDIDGQLFVQTTNESAVQLIGYDNVDGSGNLNPLVINDNGSLNVAIVQEEKAIFYVKVADDEPMPYEESFDASLNYECGSSSIISYQDSSVSETAALQVFGEGGSGTNTYEMYLGLLQPIVIGSVRYASGTFNLSSFEIIKVKNLNVGVNLTNVTIQVVSSS